MVYFVSRNILKLIFKICFRIKVYGHENFPVKGPVIVAPNHASFLDPILVGISMRRRLYFMARHTLFKNKIAKIILPLVNALPLKREGIDTKAFKIVLDKLQENKAVLIFPEGTRTRDGSLQEPKQGIGFLKVASGAKVVPCYIKGSREALPRGAVYPRFKNISVYFGKPLDLRKYNNDLKKENYAGIAVETMAAIRALKEHAD